MVIDENPGSDVEVSFVALVDKPAIEKNFLVFQDNFVKPDQGESKDDYLKRCIPYLVNEGKEQDQAVAICNSMWDNKGFSMNFKIDNEQEQIISGPAMVADTLIYRNDQNGEYNVFFSKDTIKQIALKFFKKDYQKNLNLFHDPALPLDGVTIFESFVSDKARGVEPMKDFKDLPDGTWFISAKIENPEVWAKIKSGEVKGFSVEGIFSYVKKPKEKGRYDLEEILNATIGDVVHFKESDLMALKDLLTNFKQKFIDKKLLEFELKDKSKVLITEFAVGGKITIGDKPAPAGKLEFLDGSTATVDNAGTIVQTTPPPVANLAKDYTLKDGTTTVNISEMKVGGVAMIGGVPAPAGEYELSDGTKCTIGEGGLITAITPAAGDPNMMTEQKVNELIGKALQAHQALMAEQKTKLESAEKIIGEQKTALGNQDKKIAGLFELVEELAKAAPDPVGDPKLSFAQQNVKTAEEKRAALVERLRTLRKVS